MKIWAVVVGLLGFWGLANAEGAPGAVAFRIEPQALGDALNEFAHQSGMQLLVNVQDLPAGRAAPRVEGRLRPEEALQELLAGSGLGFEFVNGRVVAVQKGEGKALLGMKVGQVGGASGEGNGAAAAPAGQGAEPNGEKVELTEIIVTAQKKKERLLDVPESVSVMDNKQLQSLRINSLSDLSDYIPGMSIQDGGAPGSRQISIRGLNTAANNFGTAPTVGTYIDDVDVGCASGSASGARCAIYGVDLNPYDVKQIEVLKGPQGTLYGASTLGGLIKYSLYSPDLEQFHAGVNGDLQYIDGSSRSGGGGGAFVSLPIVTGQLGVRMSGFYKNTAGYIDNDNATIGAKNVNSSTEKGGLATILWQPADTLAVKATILAQDIDVPYLTAEDFNGATGQPLNQPPASNIKFPSSFNQTTRLYSLGVNWNLGFGTLTSSTAWSNFDSVNGTDVSILGFFCAPRALGATWPGCPTYPHEDALVDFALDDYVGKFVQEIRLASPEDRKLQWMLGGYYTHENSRERQDVPIFTPTYVLLPPAESILHQLQISDYKESAAFANLTLKVSDRFDVGAGGRYSDYSRGTCIVSSSGLIGQGPQPCESLPSTRIGVWMTDARFHLNNDEMLYARVATGYRPGSGCSSCGNPAVDNPGIVNPDKTKNYEIGFKSQWFDRRLQLDVAAFYVDWKDIQLSIISPITHTGFPGNGGGASSSGVELTTAYSITSHFQLNATLARIDAHLTQTVLGVGDAGDRLPVSPLWDGAISADYSFPLSGDRLVLLGSNYRYRDSIATTFASQPGYSDLIPQNVVGLYAGIGLRNTTIRLYGTNIFNNHSFTGGGITNTTSSVTPVQPRTVGLGVDVKF